jgi:hypothetical protein
LLQIFPRFERPAPPPPFLNIRPERRGIGLKIAGVLAAGLAVAIALTPQSPDVPPPTAVATRAVLEDAPAQKLTSVEAPTTPVPEKTVGRAAKLAVTCARTTTARRDCVEAKEAKAAVLASAMAAADTPRPAAAKSAETTASATASETNALAAIEGAEADAGAVTVPAPPRQRPKAKKRFIDEAPVDRLVRVYDQIMPDGRRVPVYRRAGGSYESGSIVDGEYRRASAPPAERTHFFGLQ